MAAMLLLSQRGVDNGAHVASRATLVRMDENAALLHSPSSPATPATQSDAAVNKGATSTTAASAAGDASHAGIAAPISERRTIGDVLI